MYFAFSCSCCSCFVPVLEAVCCLVLPFWFPCLALVSQDTIQSVSLFYFTSRKRKKGRVNEWRRKPEAGKLLWLRSKDNIHSTKKIKQEFERKKERKKRRERLTKRGQTEHVRHNEGPRVVFYMVLHGFMSRKKQLDSQCNTTCNTASLFLASDSSPD